MPRAVIPIDEAIIDDAQLPVYLRIAATAKHLWELGMSDRAIAGALGVTDKRIAKAVGLGIARAPGMPHEKGSHDQASPVRLPSKDVPSGCGLGCPHPDGT
ncbi:MAG TPA: hypothetical protein VMA77_05005 [Solirubrobacteraceae bacterium]|nr:hypothetical protein [Solirubrobacteraceae bacterium]